jgi:hypothetical protein
MSSLNQLHPNSRHHSRIVQCPVPLDLSGRFPEQVPIYRFQFVVPQAGKARPAQFKRATALILQCHAQAGVFMEQKYDIKRRIVGNENGILNEFVKAGEYFFGFRLAYKHFLGNAVDKLRRIRDAFSGLYKGMEFIDNSLFLDSDGADFNYSVTSPW